MEWNPIQGIQPPNAQTALHSEAHSDQLLPANSEARKQSIERCIQLLVHAAPCREQNCLLPSCQKMKRVVGHMKACKRKTNGGCPICKQLIALCCYHAKHCQEVECPVPFCRNIKHKLTQQQVAQRVQQAELLRRRVAFMNIRSMPVAKNGPSPMMQGKGNVMAGMAAGSAGGSTTITQNNPIVGPARNEELQQMMMNLKDPQSPDQRQQILNILKSNPQLMAAFIKQRAAQAQNQNAQQGGGSPSPGHLQQIMNQQQQQQQQPVQQGPLGQQQVQKQQQVRSTLRSNSQLMTAIIKQRAAQTQFWEAQQQLQQIIMDVVGPIDENSMMQGGDNMAGMEADGAGGSGTVTQNNPIVDQDSASAAIDEQILQDLMMMLSIENM